MMKSQIIRPNCSSTNKHPTYQAFKKNYVDEILYSNRNLWMWKLQKNTCIRSNPQRNSVAVPPECTMSLIPYLILASRILSYTKTFKFTVIYMCFRVQNEIDLKNKNVWYPRRRCVMSSRPFVISPPPI